MPGKEINVKSPEIQGASIGTVYVENVPLGHGAFKQVVGPGFIFSPNTGGEINLGAAGTPVTAEVNPESPLGTQVAQHYLQVEKANWESLVQSQAEHSQGRGPFPALRRHTAEGSADQLREEGIPFPQDIHDIVRIIQNAPEDILPRREKTVMLLFYLYNNASTVEAVHALRVNGISIVHGDLGQHKHLHNIVSSARTGDTRVVDVSLAQLAKPNGQQNEIISAQRVLGDLVLQYPHVFDLIPDIKINTGLLVRPDALREKFRQEIRKLDMGKEMTNQELGDTLQKDYFLAYLWDKLAQHGIRESRAYVTAIADAIDQYYQEGDTVEVPSVKPPLA